MLNFSKNETGGELHPLVRIKTLSAKIDRKIQEKDDGKHDGFVESLSVEELKDLRQVMLASEYLLTKYQDKRDLKEFLEEFIGIMMHATNSINWLKSDLEDLVMSAETALEQVQILHGDVTHNLAFKNGIPMKLDDFKITSFVRNQHHDALLSSDSKPLCETTSSINLTNTTRRVNTNDYLERTAVEI